MQTQKIVIEKEEDVSLAALSVHILAEKIGFSVIATSAITTATSEIARNVVKYATRGWATLKILKDEFRTGIEVVILDIGPGIADIDNALKDRTSTSGTLGLGLPGTKRLVDEFSIESKMGEGTTVRMVKWDQK